MNGQRSFTKSKAHVRDRDLNNWVDPTFASPNPWNYCVPKVLVDAGFGISGEEGGTDFELYEIYPVRSIEEGVRLSKLTYFGDIEGIDLIKHREGHVTIRRIIEERVLRIATLRKLANG